MAGGSHAWGTYPSWRLTNPEHQQNKTKLFLMRVNKPTAEAPGPGWVPATSPSSVLMTEAESHTSWAALLWTVAKVPV